MPIMVVHIRVNNPASATDQMAHNMSDGIARTPHTRYESRLAIHAGQTSPDELLHRRERGSPLSRAPNPIMVRSLIWYRTSTFSSRAAKTVSEEQSTYGLPVVVKDNIAIKGEPTTAVPRLLKIELRWMPMWSPSSDKRARLYSLAQI